ncbi:MAG: o-succinylbenzoate synthase [Muribaculaceae bacterium]|nr:o-succinylbenzoate synthase [Muribaculaceae bacterium]
MRQKDTYFIKVWDDEMPDSYGIGESALFRGLSYDDRPGYERMLKLICADPLSALVSPEIVHWPSIRMGLESAILDYRRGSLRTLFPGDWRNGESSLKINGLVWMGTEEEMVGRMKDKIEAGFTCVKIKIGGIDFEREMALLGLLRSIAPEAELRLDANGAFTREEALRKLERLAAFNIHSLEQPIKAGQWEEMSRICRQSPIPIALDEELISITTHDERHRMLETIKPKYIIIKPTLIGGFTAGNEWIEAAGEHGTGWWATSALESDIGLNAIAQWTAHHSPTLPQGLGTGQLFENNIPSPLRLEGDRIMYDNHRQWLIPQLEWN